MLPPICTIRTSTVYVPLKPNLITSSLVKYIERGPAKNKPKTSKFFVDPLVSEVRNFRESDEGKVVLYYEF